MQSVLIVDHDLGFVFWLGRALDAAGYCALPAKDVTSALELLNEFPVTVSLLIISQHETWLPLLKVLLAKNQSLKIIALAGDRKDVGKLALAGRSANPDCSDEAPEAEWLAIVESTLTANSRRRWFGRTGPPVTRVDALD